MTRKWPILPTIVVLAAVATMVMLGVWQLQRKAEKDALLAAYAAASNLPPIGWPTIPTAASFSGLKRGITSTRANDLISSSVCCVSIRTSSTTLPKKSRCDVA